METYGGTQAMEMMSVDPVAEWAAPGGETGLEEPMWQLGLGGGPESYPARPDEPDCIHYLRTGFCGYGNRCRFNHPRDRSSAMGSLRTSGDDYPERIGQPVCQVVLAGQLVCWTAQFIGHGIFEKRAPALLDNLVRAFLMAPFFVLLEALHHFFGYEPYPGFYAKVNARVDAEIKEWQEKKQKKSS